MARNRKKKDLDWLFKNYLEFFEEFGMNKYNIVSYFQTWKKDRPEIIEDYLWFIFNHLLNENAKQSENYIDLLKRNDRIYSEMLHFRRKFEQKKANEIQKLYNENKVNLDLESNLHSNLEMEFIIIGTNDCEESKKISEKTITIKQAIENKTIPYEKCTRKQGCVCLMGLKPKRDEKGNLIWKKNE
ncbi:hypothetical protein LPB03_13585 [Polaribacter vadi]|uniref:Uncharacterized protein n=1 Tax=Polaribacter vadi TaxID=1774273 RepID=A0A1B8U2H0_9FLAO|nr:hypothetical protein [Polaribacter vadi]AOW18423.1 hypothetical protein LPB03_13585 [Polaribacter vadi]OBY66084.1 hypothetical protein LPB3_02035 [Polaribacter vadi]